MIGLPFITDLFTNILGASRTIEGRLFYCAKGGGEINTDTFDQVITQSFSSPEAKVYPVVIMPPPGSRFTGGDWETYNISLFFLTSSFYGPDGIKDVNPDTMTAQHTILADAHDMGRAARNFLNALDALCRARGLVADRMRYLGKVPAGIFPVAEIGVDRLAGVRIDFVIDVFNGCKMEDYNLETLAEIVIPQDDSHPEH